MSDPGTSDAPLAAGPPVAPAPVPNAALPPPAGAAPVGAPPPPAGVPGYQSTPVAAPYAPPPSIEVPLTRITERRPKTSTLGTAALTLAVIALILPTTVGAISAGMIAAGTEANTLAEYLRTSDGAALAAWRPVRIWALVGEVAFWSGAVVGTWALIQGIVAAVTQRGRRRGIIAAIIAAVAPLAFFGASVGVYFIVGAPRW